MFPSNLNTFEQFMKRSFMIYYESIKRKLNRRLVLECRCDERLKAKAEGSTRLTYTGWRCYSKEKTRSGGENVTLRMIKMLLIRTDKARVSWWIMTYCPVSYPRVGYRCLEYRSRNISRYSSQTLCLLEIITPWRCDTLILDDIKTYNDTMCWELGIRIDTMT